MGGRGSGEGRFSLLFFCIFHWDSMLFFFVRARVDDFSSHLLHKSGETLCKDRRESFDPVRFLPRSLRSAPPPLALTAAGGAVEAESNGPRGSSGSPPHSPPPSSPSRSPLQQAGYNLSQFPLVQSVLQPIKHSAVAGAGRPAGRGRLPACSVCVRA